MSGRIALEKLARRVLGIGRSSRGKGLDAPAMIRQLEAVAGDEGAPSSPGAADESKEVEVSTNVESGAALPAALAAVPAELIVDADVREILRAGGEPFAQIMAARRELKPGGVLRVRAIFEPAPLYFVFGSQGFEHWTEQLDEEDWRVWFFESSAAAAGEAAQASPAAETGSSGDDVVILDVRGLEPPEPMVRTLAALDTLPAGKTLLQINVREPKFLLPMLENRGFTYEVREQGPGVVRTFIRRR